MIRYNRYTLIVKGNNLTAERTAASRGFTVLRSVPSIPGFETVVVVSIPSHLAPKLHEWLTSPPSEAPYPPGSLLCFTEHHPCPTCGCTCESKP